MPIIDDILSEIHPQYAELAEDWARDELRYRAGRSVRGELAAFPWEEVGGLHHTGRKLVALAPPLMRNTGERFVGTLFEQAPTPDFGSLGEVRQEREGTPTRAELIYDAVDGVGYGARGWDAFWRDETARGTATGFRWHYLDAPEGDGPNSAAEEIAGTRPYVQAYSPLAVPDWHEDKGVLQYARIIEEAREPRIENGSFTASNVTRHLLLVRAGYTGFGDEYAGGGWWTYDDSKTLTGTGNWDRTAGEIPMWRLIYDESGEGLSDLGSVQIALMNLLSALYHDGIVGGGHGQTVMGVNVEQAESLAAGYNKGSRVRFVPGVAGTTPAIHDDAAASASTALTEAIRHHRDIAQEVIMKELVTAPDSSGAARALEFVTGASPRLTAMAINVEEAQNICIHFFQQRFGLAVTGAGVTWPKRYDLRPALDKVLGVLDVFDKAGIKPPPDFTAKAIGSFIEREGMTGDSDPRAMEAEIAANLRAQHTVQASEARTAERRAQPPGARVAGLLGTLGGDGAGGEPVVG